MPVNPPIDAASPDLLRGEGCVPARPHRDPLAELRLFRHALAQGWPVSADLKVSATGRIREILANPKAGNRAYVAATRCLLTMTSATTASIDCAVRVRASEEFDERLKQLEAWQAGGTDQEPPRPRIDVPDRDRRYDRNRIIVERRDRANEEHRGETEPVGGSSPEPASPPGDRGPAAHEPETDRRDA